jgi:1,4-alpha-glucan branching enzyme
MPRGYIVFVLHAHLPYVLSHGKWPHGSDWLCEAACETYIPLLNALVELSSKGTPPGLTIGITPILCEMLASPLFGPTFKSYVAEKIDAAVRDRRAFASEEKEEQAELARRWEEFYRCRLADFTGIYGEDLVGAFRKLQDEGRIEIIVSAATHAYLPLLGSDASIRAQLAQGMETYRKHFRAEPRGMWLPECAYCPEREQDPAKKSVRRGLEAFLAGSGLDYFFVDPPRQWDTERPAPDQAHPAGVPSLQYVERLREDLGRAPGLYQDPAPPAPDDQTDIYAVYRTGRPEQGQCSFFMRDVETSHRVWSGQWGYPGDPFYLEFHKKRDPGGLRYWRVTDREGDLGAKLPYESDKARERTLVHAAHFRKVVEEKLERYRAETGRTGVLTLLFDAELFGHWWFEGIEWLTAFMTAPTDAPLEPSDEKTVSAREGGAVSAFGENCAKIERASVVLQDIAPLGTVNLPEGSWGEGGFHLTWHNKETAWTWEFIRDAEQSMSCAAAERTDETGERIKRQMARELFLLQASDWQFLITTGTAGDYGESRFLGHLAAFESLRKMLDIYRETGRLTDSAGKTLRQFEEQDAVFDNVKPEWFEERTEDGL